MTIRSVVPLRPLLLAAACALAFNAAPAAAETPGVPEIHDLWLIDAATNARLFRLTDYQSLNLAFLPSQLTIEAEADGDTQSVRFTMDEVQVALHDTAPYALGPDNAGDFDPVPALRNPGWVTIKATPFGGDGATGAAGAVVTRHLYRLQTDFVVNSVADLADAKPGDGKCESGDLGLAIANVQAPPVADPVLTDEMLTLPFQFGKGPSLAGAAVQAAAQAAPGREALTPNVPDPGNGIVLRKVCTLRAAIQEANALPGRQTISLDGRDDKVYRITKGQLAITDGLAIYGHELPTVDAERRSRLLHISGTESKDILVDLNGVDLANGNAGSIERGGVMQVQYGTVQVFNSIIRGGEGNFGGGMYLQYGGNALISETIVRNNKAGTPENFGGGGATQRGGGIFNLEGSVTIRNSAIVDNIAVRGGGVSNYGGLMRIENSSILDNEARSLGGGIENRHNNGKTANLHISFSTITGNQAGTSLADPQASRVGGGLYNAGRAYMASSVLAQNSEPFGAGNPHTSPDCYSPNPYDFKSYRNNLVGVINGNCSFGDYSSGTGFGIQSGTDPAPLNPQLGARIDSPLPRRLPLPGSPLVDAGGGAGAVYPCPDTDIRGNPRPVGAACDIGSVERQ